MAFGEREKNSQETRVYDREPRRRGTTTQPDRGVVGSRRENSANYARVKVSEY